MPVKSLFTVNWGALHAKLHDLSVPCSVRLSMATRGGRAAESGANARH